MTTLIEYWNIILIFFMSTFEVFGFSIDFICSNIFIKLKQLLWYISNLDKLFHSFLEEKINGIVRRCTQNFCCLQNIFFHIQSFMFLALFIFSQDDKPFNFVKLKKKSNFRNELLEIYIFALFDIASIIITIMCLHTLRKS